MVQFVEWGRKSDLCTAVLLLGDHIYEIVAAFYLA